MTFTYAQIKNNAVVGVYEYTQAVVADDLVLIEEKISVSIGDVYLDGAFSQSASVNDSDETKSLLIKVILTQVSGTLTGFADRDNQFTVNESTDIIASGTLAIADQKFRVPFKRLDTGRIQLMVAEVVDGQFTLSMNFKTGGIWVVNNELINAELTAPMFSIEEYQFAVI